MTHLSFTINNTAFHLTPVGDRYEWHTLDGQCRAGRMYGRETYWATCGGIRLGSGKEYRTLGAAMLAAARFKELMGVRPCSPADALRGPSSNEAGLSFDLREAA